MFANQSCATISFSRKKYIGSNLSEKITSQSLDLFCTTWLVFWKKSLLMMPSFSSANYDKCHNYTLQSISNPCHNNTENIFEVLGKDSVEFLWKFGISLFFWSILLWFFFHVATENWWRDGNFVNIFQCILWRSIA